MQAYLKKSIYLIDDSTRGDSYQVKSMKHIMW